MGNFKVIMLVVFCILVSAGIVFAALSGNVNVISPFDNSYVNGNFSINTTFLDQANISIYYSNSTVSLAPLNYSNLQINSYNYTWKTTNYPDGSYNFSIVAINSTNFSDNQTIIITNVSVDNTPPGVGNVTALGMYNISGILYINSTNPSFYANVSDSGSGLLSCSITINATNQLSYIPATLDGGVCYNNNYQGFFDGEILNVSFLAKDNLNNANISKNVYFTVDSAGPVINITTQNGSIHKNADAFILTAKVSDLEVGVNNGTYCNATFNDSGNYTANLSYNNASWLCNGTILIGAPNTFADGSYLLNITVSDRLNNKGVASMQLFIDNTEPTLYGINITNSHPMNLNASFNISVQANDSRQINSVMIGNGTNFILMNFTSGNSTSANYSSAVNASFFNCQNESFCTVSIVANDSAGNVNQINLTGVNQLYFDTNAPIMVLNGTNVTIAYPNDDVVFYAKWNDISLIDSNLLVSNLTIYNSTSSQFVSVYPLFNYFASFGNYTNFSYMIPPAYEGQVVISKISLTDVNNHVGWSDNLTIVVQNASPIVSITSPANNSFLLNNGRIFFEINESGIGLNVSTILVQVNGTQNISMPYGGINFSCTTLLNSTTMIERTNCSLNGSWPIGYADVTLFASDYLGNSNSSTSQFFITSKLPDIVNISVDGIIVANSTLNGTLHSAVISNDSNTIFNWSVDSEFALLNTTILIANLFNSSVVYDARNFSVLPASTAYDLAPGVHHLIFNASFVQSVFESADLYLTLDVLYNASSLRSLYTSRGIVNNWSVYINGADATNSYRSMNAPLDIILTGNATGKVPFSFLMNYSGLHGLDLNWNYSNDDFNITSGNNADYNNFSGDVGANVTAVIKYAIPGTLSSNGLIDNASLFYIDVNLSAVNRTFYYGTYNQNMWLLQKCAITPTIVLNATNACYAVLGNNTRIFLPYIRGSYDAVDYIFSAEPPTTNISINVASPSSLVSQSIIPLSLNVYSAFPNNANFCSYNLSKFNSISNISSPYLLNNIAVSAFNASSYYWSYNQSIMNVPDGQYNLSVACNDQFGLSATTKSNFLVLDTTPPLLSNVDAIQVGLASATITGSTNELANFTAYYSTSLNGSSNSQNSMGLRQNTTSIILTDLYEGTRYYYTLRACDVKAQCSYSNGTFVTIYPQSSSAGGSGGGGGGIMPDPNAPGAIQDSNSRVWGAIGAGIMLEFLPVGNLSVHKLSVKFLNDTTAVKLGVTQYRVKPSEFQIAPNIIYAYFSIDHSNFDNRIDKPFIEFDVPKSWLKNQNIDLNHVKLYRYENSSWQAYSAQKIEDLPYAYRFNSVTPGFSFYAIGGESNAGGANSAVNNASVQTPIAHPSNPASASTNDSNHGPDIIVKQPKSPSTSWSMIIGIAAVICLLVVFGFKYYKKYEELEQKRHLELDAQKQEIEHRKYVAVRGEQVGLVLTKPLDRKDEHDPMAQLHHYIVNMRLKNKSDEEIKSSLLAVGWDPVIVDMELLRK